MRRPPSSFFACCALAACAACAGSDNPADMVAVRDSAGIRIVESAAPRTDTAEGPRLAAEPVIRIGVLEGEPAYQFEGIRQVLLRPDGGLVTGDRSHEIRFFDAAGTHVRSVGGTGGGPGEYRVISALFPLRGDSLLVWDGNLERATLLGPEGELGGTVSAIESSFPRMAGIMADGTPLWWGGAGLTDWPMGPVEVEAELILADRAGAVIDTIWRERYEGSVGVMLGDSRTLTSLPYGRRVEAVAAGERIFAIGGARNELQVLDSTGSLVELHRWAGAPQPVTEELRQAYRDRMMRFFEGRDDEALRRRMYDDIAFPETLPTYDQIRVDRVNGRVWLRRYMLPEQEPPVWTLLDADGTWLADVPTPPRFDLLDVADDRVAGVWRDELDVAYVHV
ncbi:MAG: hypothetical protein WEA24_06575, partial [Gemmatimonadota bacterium]